MAGFLKFVFVIFPLIVLLGALLFWFAFDRPFGSDSDPEVQILVPQGAHFAQIVPQLDEKGLISSRRYLLLRYFLMDKFGRLAPLQAGRFSISPGSRPSEIIRALTSPDESQRVYTTFTVPPGLSSSDLAGVVERRGLASASDVLKAIRELASDYPVKKTPEGLQGYLFPDTYKIEPPLSSDAASSRAAARMIVTLMADQFFSQLDNLYPGWERLTRAQLHEKVILASIVEREYRVAEEAPLIAAVFNNRINEGMRLESCATVVYAIEETGEGARFKDEYYRFNRRIFEQYLEIPSMYNTYRYPGMPPGPICSPGKTALEAALYPADSDALFFVVKNPEDGTHVFSRNYSDHLNARDTYLRQFVVKE